MLGAGKELQQQSEFQRLIIHLATRFINQPIDQIDEAIGQALREVTEFLGGARASINHLIEDGTQFYTPYEWCIPSLQGAISRISSVPVQSQIIPIFSQGQAVVISNMTQLPLEDTVRQRLEPHGLLAVASVPLFDGGKLFGFISMAWMHIEQPEAQVLDLLKIVGEIALNALNRKRHEEQIQGFSAELEQRIVERTAELREANEQLQLEIVQRQHVETALRESESQIRLILESLPIPVAVVGNISDIMYINPIAGTVLNITPEDVNLTLDPEHFYVDLRDRDRMLLLLETQGYVSGLEVRYRTYPESIRIGLMSAQPIQFGGEPARILTLMDITELKLSQEAEHSHRLFTEALLDAAMALSSTLEFDEMLGLILNSLHRVLPHDIANIMIEDGDDVLIVRQPSNDQAALDQHTAPRVLPYVKQMFEIDYPILTSNMADSPPLIPDFVDTGIASYIGVPILMGKEVIGWINLGSYQADFFTETHLNYLQIFALQAGMAIQNARLYKQARLIAAMEERQHLARELHDSVTQTLFSANTIAEALPRIIEKAPHEVANYLSELHLLTRGAMAEMRSLLFELRPATLEQTDLSVLLAELCYTFTGKTRVSVDTRLVKKLSLPPDVQLAFYRIAQEALNNASKYARAQHVTVDWTRIDGVAELRINDDGCGFNPAAVTADHFGLKMMRERAESIQAELTIHSQPNVGTEIILRRRLS